MEMSEDEDEEFTTADLMNELNKVRKKIRTIKGESEMKKNLRARSKIKKLDDVTAALEKKGIDVNKESLATRVKNPKRISELEKAQDAKAKRELGADNDDSSDDESIDSDANMKKKEGEERGRSRKEREEKKSKKMLGKRRPEKDIDMISDEEESGVRMEVRGSLGKQKRSMTPA